MPEINPERRNGKKQRIRYSEEYQMNAAKMVVIDGFSTEGQPPLLDVPWNQSARGSESIVHASCPNRKRLSKGKIGSTRRKTTPSNRACFLKKPQRTLRKNQRGIFRCLLMQFQWKCKVVSLTGCVSTF